MAHITMKISREVPGREGRQQRTGVWSLAAVVPVRVELRIPGERGWGDMPGSGQGVQRGWGVSGQGGEQGAATSSSISPCPLPSIFACSVH